MSSPLTKTAAAGIPPRSASPSLGVLSSSPSTKERMFIREMTNSTHHFRPELNPTPEKKSFLSSPILARRSPLFARKPLGLDTAKAAGFSGVGSASPKSPVSPLVSSPLSGGSTSPLSTGAAGSGPKVIKPASGGAQKSFFGQMSTFD